MTLRNEETLSLQFRFYISFQGTEGYVVHKIEMTNCNSKKGDKACNYNMIKV